MVAKMKALLAINKEPEVKIIIQFFLMPKLTQVTHVIKIPSFKNLRCSQDCCHMHIFFKNRSISQYTLVQNANFTLNSEPFQTRNTKYKI